LGNGMAAKIGIRGKAKTVTTNTKKKRRKKKKKKKKKKGEKKDKNQTQSRLSYGKNSSLQDCRRIHDPWHFSPEGGGARGLSARSDRGYDRHGEKEKLSKGGKKGTGEGGLASHQGDFRGDASAHASAACEMPSAILCGPRQSRRKRNNGELCLHPPGKGLGQACRGTKIGRFVG